MGDSRRARASTAHPDRWQAWTTLLVEWLNTLQPPEMAVLTGTALFVGLGAGFGAVIFRWLINGFTTLAFEGGRQAFSFLGHYYVLIIPAIGGLFVGPMIYRFAREAKGHGVPEVMEAVALKGGRIRPIVVVIKALASSICIGTGGSAGREGPIVQIGSALGSTVGQALRMSDDRIRMLVACGAAGGIAATFNAPVAGVIFALEIILGEFTVGHFSTVVIASVTASVIARVFLGNVPAFAVPEYALRSPWELPLYVLLGILAAPVGVGFIRALYRLEDIFDAWNFPEYLKPVIGGLGVGAIGLFAPQVFGVGYEAIEVVLHNGVVLSTIVMLLFAKILATSLTLGSGGSGGVFAPSLFMGAMLGGTFGDLVHRVLPGITALPGAYALVGMAAVFAAGAHAPITAIIILFEMTGDYRIILPLMLSTVIATLLAQRLETESIYTMKLSRRGIRLERGRDIDVMQSVQVAEAMTTDLEPVPVDMSLNELAQRFQRDRRHAFPVVDHDNALYGIVSLQDLERVLTRENGDKLTAGDIATRSLVIAYPDEPMRVALKRMGPRDLSTLPVVDRNDPRKLIGVIRRRDIVKAYNVGIMHRQELQHRIAQMRLHAVTGPEFIELEIPEDSPAVGVPLAELALPTDCVIVSIQRDHQLFIPHGDTVLQAGDKVTAFVERDEAAALKRSVGCQ
ncbi:MAG: CBS domain-containing protein [Chloroflexi bacterium]|nr:MAG: CBS domain-containing protein [Chloroflexota bacterium]